jgi:hypothetical protein
MVIDRQRLDKVLEMALTIHLSAFRSSKAFILFTICTACLTDGFTYGLVAPVIPFLLRDENLATEKDSKSPQE